MANLDNRSVLVIDDDTVIRDAIQSYLIECGFDANSVSTGSAALSLIESWQPSVIVCDLCLNDMTGLDVLKHLKSAGHEIPVIIISGRGQVADVAEALRLGAADYLLKPVSMDTLQHAISQSLELHDLQLENLRYRLELEQINKELREYVRVLERDQRAANHVQTNLLPSSPKTYCDIHLEHKLVPSLYLSGDFIDYGCIDERFVCFYLIDVSGHGAASAFVAIWLKDIVRRLFREKKYFRSRDKLNMDLERLIGVVNEEMFKSKFGAHFTCCVGVIDTLRNDLRYILAGHLPLPVLLEGEAENKTARFLSGKGKPVGMFPDAKWQANHIQLPDSYTLVLFSDGVLEIVREKSLIDKEQALLTALEVSNANGAAEIADAFGCQMKTDMPDDLSILTVTR